MAAKVKKEKMRAKKIQVFVVVPRQHYKPVTLVALEVSTDDTVASVKGRLHDMEGITPKRQHLVYGDSALPDGDVTTLADHGVGDSSTMQLVETKMQVFVRAHRTLVFNGLESSDTVESFRAKFEEREGCPPEQQWLSYCSMPLKDGHMLADFGVRDSSTLEFLLRWAVALRAQGIVRSVNASPTRGA
ncbi:polyubiquitin-like [Aegilops tauschii subsp. strangulata]|uniref:polyubiquitin-like n=1 Tax=Aegilops tauschii subsp. strangulata TaxID=200361 RepID=UPI00098B1032|nr:polyubiquitin-like [Aegilops tauschii subsp. strangulata]